MGPQGNFDVGKLSLEDNKVQAILTSQFRETDPTISPDGRWLAYTSDESGRQEIYVRPYGSGTGRWQVSDNGGGYPRWTKNGRELVYRVDDGIMAASIEATDDSVRSGKPLRLFTGKFRGGASGVTIGGANLADYDVSADGQRFIMATAGGLVFGSTNEGNVYALDAATGDALWDFQAGGPCTANPIAFQIDGHQHIATACRETAGRRGETPAIRRRRSQPSD